MRLREIAEKVGGQIVGDGDVEIHSTAPINEAGPGQITFVANPRYASKLRDTKASAVIVSPDLDIKKESGHSFLIAANPYLTFARTMSLLYPRRRGEPGVSPSAHLSPGAVMGKDVVIHPLVYIGKGAVIGDRVELYPGVHIGEGCTVGEDTVIYANASVYSRCRIGKRVIIHSGVVIGSDGFGFAQDGTRHLKIPQEGIVEIEDDVEIGANTTIDRATMGKTLIKRGTKIDNLVQIAHNVVIGEDCIIIAQVGISGSTQIGNNVILAGQVGVVGHIVIGDNVMVGAQSGVVRDVPANNAVSGSPAFPHREWLKAVASFQFLPDLRRRLAALERRIEEMLKEKRK